MRPRSIVPLRTQVGLFVLLLFLIHFSLEATIPGLPITRAVATANCGRNNGTEARARATLGLTGRLKFIFRPSPKAQFGVSSGKKPHNKTRYELPNVCHAPT